MFTEAYSSSISKHNMKPQILSQRERQILELIAYENTNDDIAETLYISNQTVKTHRRNLLEKLSARNTAGMIRRAFELGLLSLSHSMGAN